MTVNINAGNISSIRLVEQSSNPSTPTSGSTRLFVDNSTVYNNTLNSNTPLLKMIADDGTVTTFIGNVTASGVGITFPPLQVPSTNANTLDDYEEGTWTPTWIATGNPFGTITYNSAATFGIYTKIGNMVYVQGGIATDTFAVGSATANVQVSGLPFVANSTANRYGGICVTRAVNFASTTRRPFSGIVQSGTTNFWTYYRTSSEGDVNNSAVADLLTGTNTGSNAMYFFGFYQV